MTSYREWRLLALLFVLSFLNYIDRANLSVGATDIQRDLHISSYQLGLLLSALFWTYAVLQLANISGWVVDRFNVGWVDQTIYGWQGNQQAPAGGISPAYGWFANMEIPELAIDNSILEDLNAQPELYSPVNGSTLPGSAFTFQWTQYPGATAYWLDIGAT